MKLKDYLIKHDLSVRALGEIAQCSYSTIYRFLHGKCFSVTTAKKIEKATGGDVTFEELIDHCKKFKNLFGIKDE